MASRAAVNKKSRPAKWSYPVQGAIRLLPPVANNPDATILGGFGVNQGSGSGGLIAATDALSISANGDTWTYNFERFATKKDCKKAAKEDAKDDDKDKDKDKDKCKEVGKKADKE
jgi:hypothetical protein